MRCYMKKKWYQHTAVIILLLYFCWPVGLYLMWKYTNWSPKVKKGITAVFIGVVVIGMLIGLTAEPEEGSETTKAEIVENEVEVLNEDRCREALDAYFEDEETEKIIEFSEKSPEVFGQIAVDYFCKNLPEMNMVYGSGERNLHKLQELKVISSIFAEDTRIQEIEKGLGKQAEVYTMFSQDTGDISNPEYIPNHDKSVLLSGYLRQRLEGSVFGYTDYYVMVGSSRGEDECLVKFLDGVTVSPGNISVQAVQNGTQSVQNEQGFEYELVVYEQVNPDDLRYSALKDDYSLQGNMYRDAVNYIANGYNGSLEDAILEGWRVHLYNHLFEQYPGTAKEDYTIYENDDGYQYSFEVYWNEKQQETYSAVGFYSVVKETNDFRDDRTMERI